MERGLLSKKGSGGGRGVKEKNEVVAEKDVVSPSVIDEVKEKQSSMFNTSIPNVETTSLSLYPPLPTHGSTLAGNTLGMYSYANVTGEPSRKALNFHTLFTPWGNGVDVVVPVESIRAISERFTNTAYGLFLGNSMDGLNTMLENGPWFIRNHPLILKKWNLNVNLLKEDVGNVSVWVKLHGVPITVFSEDGLSVIATKISTPLMLDFYTSDMCLQSWGRSSYARAMIELRADVELKDTIMVDMPKITREGFYTCTIRVEYEWKPRRCACCKVFGHIQEECPKNPGLGVAKNLKKPSQAPRGVLVGSNVGFKPVKQAYKPVSTKPTANTKNKKNDVQPIKKVVIQIHLMSLTRLKMMWIWVPKRGLQIWKFEKQNIDGKVTLVDDEGEPVKKFDYPVDHVSEDEVASVDNDMARSMASEKVGFGQEIPDKIQAICDNLDIKVRGRKKK
ncbi:putative reverse transcriptase domain-containing protein [Tanacetum coccineum]